MSNRQSCGRRRLAHRNGGIDKQLGPFQGEDAGERRVGEVDQQAREEEKRPQAVEVHVGRNCTAERVPSIAPPSEARDLVVLKKDEWNVLVDAIKSGRLSKVRTSWAGR